MNIAIIPARGGSRRVPRKSIRIFHDKPIIEYSIDTALASGLFSAVVVSTDDDEIGEIARADGALTWPRPAALAVDNVGTQEVIRDALIGLYPNGNYPAYVCGVYATAPLMTADDLKRGFAYLIEGGKEIVFPVGSCVVDGVEHWADAGQWYWQTRDAVMRCRDPHEGFSNLMGDIGMFPLPADRVCDINTMEDWARAHYMYAVLKSLDAAKPQE